MKKIIKIILLCAGFITLLVIVDLVCIFTIKRPLFAIKNNNQNVYKGIFYDTYDCFDYPTLQIKLKTTKFTCLTKNTSYENRIVSIKNVNENKICADALEEFYEDDEYTYYWRCIMDDFIIVEYENGSKQKVSESLKNKTITIKDLDDYNISYIKYSKNNN